MKRAQAFISLITALFLMIGGAEAQIKKTNKNNKSKYAKGMKTLKDSFKVLAEGANSEVEKPFVFVARDLETYSALQKLTPDLPKQDEKFFESNAVMAAFLGQRPTGGYGVVITNSYSKIEIYETKPPKGSMTIQVITSPYKVVVVPIENEKPLRDFSFDAAWQKEIQTYNITSGEITESGGFAGRSRTMSIYGNVKTIRYSDYITLILDINNSKGARLSTHDTVSGVIQGDGSFKFTRIDPGTLIQLPRPTLNAIGSLKDNSLTLTFDSNPTNVADGFEGKGKIEAVKK